jgi:hypothetical protein
MRRRLSLITLLTAWPPASGSQWDVVQALGWGRAQPLCRCPAIGLPPVLFARECVSAAG